jgi:electron transfer flavoprotein beta subunit
MKVLVGVKRVVDYLAKIRVKPDQSAVEFSGVDFSTNPFCEIAVEEAVRLKEKGKAASVTSMLIGPKEHLPSLQSALALGADKAIHIHTDLRTDQALQPLIVARAFRHIVLRDNYDLVLLGKQSIDDDFNQTGQLLAGLLGWPQATFAYKIEAKEGKLEVVREIDSGLQHVEVDLPAVVTCDLRLNTPRCVSLMNITKAKKKPV